MPHHIVVHEKEGGGYMMVVISMTHISFPQI